MAGPAGVPGGFYATGYSWEMRKKDAEIIKEIAREMVKSAGLRRRRAEYRMPPDSGCGRDSGD